jgi:hypothetical protein
LTRGRAATPDPFDLSAVSRSDELFDALSARRRTDPAGDPAVRLLAALAADVDAGAPPLPAPARVARVVQGTRHRGANAIVTFGVVVVVLTSAGVAAAGGGGGNTTSGSVRSDLSERSNMSHERRSGAGPSFGERPSPARPLRPGKDAWDVAWPVVRHGAGGTQAPGNPQPGFRQPGLRQPGGRPDAAPVPSPVGTNPGNARDSGPERGLPTPSPPPGTGQPPRWGPGPGRPGGGDPSDPPPGTGKSAGPVGGGDPGQGRGGTGKSGGPVGGGDPGQGQDKGTGQAGDPGSGTGGDQPGGPGTGTSGARPTG